MAENKMSQVAAMFGKKLGEEFIIIDNKVAECITVKFTENGIEAKDRWFLVMEYRILKDLLTGEAVIVDEQNG